ncbi:MAG: hypothetical protein H6510_16310 [Acidobacteria bacterium]|nr:hypothetical protein [Acidobacteriota bacterium]MCB9399377.1 hypothetical protein [Acidobacteriota bacterium]
MDKHQFEAWLENPTETDGDPELLAIMNQLEDLDHPDPGVAYWNHFQARLQQKIETRGLKPTRRHWRSWLTWGGFSLVTAALVFLVWMPRSSADPLTQLDTEALQFLESIYGQPELSQAPATDLEDYESWLELLEPDPSQDLYNLDSEETQLLLDAYQEG